METVAASQWQRGYHSLVNVRCGYQPVYFRYQGTNSTRIQLSATPNSLLTLQQESSVFKSIYKCVSWFFIRKRKFSILPFEAEASCSTKAKPREVTEGPWVSTSAFSPTHNITSKKRDIQLWRQIFHIFTWTNQRQIQLTVGKLFCYK